MAKYPELEGAPSRCLNTSPMTIDPLKVRAPYGSTDSAQVMQPAIVSMDWEHVDGVSAHDMFTKFWQNKKQDPDGIGWQSGAEMMTLDKLLRLANNVIDRRDKYTNESRNKIVDLAKAAKQQLNYIADRYAFWHGRGLAAKAPYGPQTLALHRSTEDIRQYLDPKREYGLWWPGRDADRGRIRKAWDKALRFLWCAVYGANQSKVYLENKKMAPKAATLKVQPKSAVFKAPVKKTVLLIPTTAEPDFTPGMEMPEEEGDVIEEEVIEKPKKKGKGLIAVAVAAVALLVMKK